MTASPSELLTVTFREPQHPDAELNVMFDHASSAAGATASGTEDRVVAVGVSRVANPQARTANNAWPGSCEASGQRPIPVTIVATSLLAPIARRHLGLIT